MPLNLDRAASKESMAELNKRKNPPQYEENFGPDDSAFDDDIFDSEISSDFGSSGIDSFGSSSGGSVGFGQSGFGQSGFGQTGFGQAGFGQTGFGQTGFGQTGFGQPGFNGIMGAQNSPATQEPDLMDKAMDASKEAAVSFVEIIKELCKSMRYKNADDYGYLSTNMVYTGGAVAGVAGILNIIGSLASIPLIAFGSGITSALFGSLIFACWGIVVLGFATFVNASNEEDGAGNSIPNLDSMNDMSNMMGSNDATDEYESSLDSLWNELDDLDEEDDYSTFDDEEDSMGFDANSFSASEEQFEEYQPKEEFNLDNIHSNQIMNRDILVNTFLHLLPTNEPKFADHNEIFDGQEEFEKLEAVCLKAMSNLLKKPMEDLESKLVEVQDGFFSYDIRLTRQSGVATQSKLDELAREMESYLRDGPKDTSVNVTIEIVRDDYRINITKGAKAVVTIGDALKNQKVLDFVRDPKVKLPLLTGVDTYGNVILEDGKVIDTIMIAGQPRSGKSWYILSILMAMMMWNTPEDVQFVLVDPKTSNLFKQLSLMPHVIGLHNEHVDKIILDVMRDLIEIEGTRRKKLILDNKCDDIWALRDKGIRLPVLYLVIDEVMTLQTDMDGAFKEFTDMLKVIISQLPFVGIRVMIVPHRATGLVDKTVRGMIQFKAAIRSLNEDVLDTLGIKKWDMPLVNPGDTALYGTSREAIYIRGLALTPKDSLNSDLIENAAKAFYKMGVEIPDTSYLEFAHNRNSDDIREQLSRSGVNSEQYNAATILKDI